MLRVGKENLNLLGIIPTMTEHNKSKVLSPHKPNNQLLKPTIQPSPLNNPWDKRILKPNLIKNKTNNKTKMQRKMGKKYQIGNLSLIRRKLTPRRKLKNKQWKMIKNRATLRKATERKVTLRIVLLTTSTKCTRDPCWMRTTKEFGMNQY